MTWCDNCLSDHSGACIEDAKRLEVLSELAAFLSHGRQPCPFCGGRGSGGPFGYAPAVRNCAYCKGSGRIRV